MTDEIFVVGNSWSIPSLEAPRPAFDQLGLTNRWEEPGITLDVQAEYIINNNVVNNFRVIWLIGHHHRADPLADGRYLLPYHWKQEDYWGKLTRELWFKKLTSIKWHMRTNALFVKAVLGIADYNNLMIIPVYRPNVIDDPIIGEHPCIFNYYLRDLVRRYPDGRGHTNQAGQTVFAHVLASEIENRWKIMLTPTG